MAKRKRGTPSGIKNGASKDEFDPSASKLKISSYEDVADSEDEFHLERDKLLLDGRAAKRSRQQEDDLELSDEEVLAYPEADDDDDEDRASDEDDEDDIDEVDGGSDADPLSGDEPDRDSAEDEIDEISGWGASKSDYYNADVAENEEDAAEEEAEARRLQAKRLKALRQADFGFDEKEWADSNKAVEPEQGQATTVLEELPQLQVTDDMAEADRLKLLRTVYPESEPLAQQLVELQPLYEELSIAARAAQKIAKLEGVQASSQSVVLVKFRALAGYLAAIAMYFALLTSTAKPNGPESRPMPATELQAHSVMDSLVRAQQIWEKVEDLVESEEEDMSQSEMSDEDDEAMDQETILLPTSTKPTKTTSTKPSKAQPQSTAEAASAARRAARLARTEESLSNLSALTSTKPSKTQKSTTRPTDTTADDANSDLGDEPSLAPHELAEKARRKKSLRFYTSQIAQRANKRANAGRAAGGDDDLPYRERFRDRQARLMKEAENRGRKGGRSDGTELDGRDGSDGEGETNAQREQRLGSDDGGDDAIALALEARAHAKKAGKAARSAAYSEARESGGRVVAYPVKEVGQDGRRELTYAIEKNKGLMARRKKENRNPRVKKRLRYEDKKKKLASMKPVFKGGEGRGGYAGELTGIKKGLVRSVKL